MFKKTFLNPRHYHTKWRECLVICIIFLSVVWGYPAISLFAVQQGDFCCIPCLKLLIMFNIFNRKTPWNKIFIYSNSSTKQNTICISAIKQKNKLSVMIHSMDSAFGSPWSLIFPKPQWFHRRWKVSIFDFRKPFVLYINYELSGKTHFGLNSIIIHTVLFILDFMNP